MGRRAFPVVYAVRVEATAGFYERLGFERHVQLPADGEPGYIGLRRDDSELAVVAREWPVNQYGLSVGTAPNFEMFVYVEDVDGVVDLLREAGVRVLRSPADMPWGERVGVVLDPNDNPVALATASSG